MPIKEKEAGIVFNYFEKINVAAIKLYSTIKIGSIIHVRGPSTDFEQVVDSIQEHNEILEEAHEGDEVGIKLKHKARKNDKIFLIQ